MHPAAELFPIETRQAVVASGAVFVRRGDNPIPCDAEGRCISVCLFAHLGLDSCGWTEPTAVQALEEAGVPLPPGWNRELAELALRGLLKLNDKGLFSTHEAVAAALGVPLPATDPEATAAVAAAEALVAGHAREVAPAV